MHSDKSFSPLARINWQKSQGLVKPWKGSFTSGHSHGKATLQTQRPGHQTPGKDELENQDPGKMVNHKTMRFKMKGSGCCSGSAGKESVELHKPCCPYWCRQYWVGNVVPAGSGTGHSYPDNGRAVLYIIWDLPNKLEGLENPSAIVHAQSLLNFLV